MELKVRKIDNSLSVVLPKEVVNRLRIEEGGRLFLIEDRDGGYQLTPKEKKQSPKAEEVLAAMRKKYDAMLARMQTPSARKGTKAAFNATPKQLAEAALEFARKHES